ncbi:hypothetical protein OESDEN_15989 [Oesophagostomum dentatum]|uniref:Uncharacterized protein n=1 Tax=Oesophagostomum dentatum TaxID=61180 RepID=A0A0B1SM67_OESDE|nr:hypothetical protein OESDEN_15989 [Oesophagostomum dentatum]
MMKYSSEVRSSPYVLMFWAGFGPNCNRITSPSHVYGVASPISSTWSLGQNSQLQTTNL